MQEFETQIEIEVEDNIFTCEVTATIEQDEQPVNMIGDRIVYSSSYYCSGVTVDRVKLGNIWLNVDSEQLNEIACEYSEVCFKKWEKSID